MAKLFISALVALALFGNIAIATPQGKGQKVQTSSSSPSRSSTASAASASPSKSSSRTQTDTYDSPEQQLKGLTPDANPVGCTAGGGLCYRGLVYANLNQSQAVIPNPSPPVSIGTGAGTMTLYGQPGWYPMNGGSFDQVSICYACDANSFVGVPTPVTCTIQLTGIRAADGRAVILPLLYNPDLLGARYNCTTFPTTFQGLARVDAQLVQAAVRDLTVMLFDNNTYTIRN